MKVSIIMSAHNSERTIGKCLKCLMRQDRKPDEIIVVDDGSTDRTSEIVKKYPVKLIRFKKNKGFAIAQKKSYIGGKRRYCMHSR